jgi:transposase InsO family protein
MESAESDPRSGLQHVRLTVGVALERAIADHMAPRSITVDHSIEFMSRALEDCAYQRGVQLDFIRPWKPVENAFIESFNRHFRFGFQGSARSYTRSLALDRMFLSPEPHLLTPATAT